MKQVWKRLRKQNEGAAMIETALVFPLFVFMTLAIFELAVIFFYSFVLESAMYQVTRFAKVQPNPSAVVDQVRDQIRQLSLGLMDERQLIITTNLNIQFADDWENADAELCIDTTQNPPALTGETCATTGCTGPGISWVDNGYDPATCNIGNPPLELGNVGDIVSYVAFYKKKLYTPGLNLLANNGTSRHFLTPAGSNQDYYVISSATISRNEP